MCIVTCHNSGRVTFVAISRSRCEDTMCNSSSILLCFFSFLFFLPFFVSLALSVFSL
ncbi:hypothetical protein BDV36DRAFT_276980 [Aspergillus pseudocaelatus]|uniref:Uncharacterized protein n=1 Tax=Aspergillus pseudocaelatus TaxID=1825620 RepID=A0ABQ6W0P6_9EURO|nr:hypothetical protein BDV36DRAFT_276980 [Aspergillus pseudocaelatus]